MAQSREVIPSFRSLFPQAWLSRSRVLCIHRAEFSYGARCSIVVAYISILVSMVENVGGVVLTYFAARWYCNILSLFPQAWLGRSRVQCVHRAEVSLGARCSLVVAWISILVSMVENVGGVVLT